MEYRLLVLIPPAVLALHNTEEALTIPAALHFLRTRLPAWAPRWAEQIGYTDYLAGLLIVTIVGLFVGAWASLRPQSRAARWTLLLLQAVLLLNVFAHLGSAALLRGYSPGLATALLLNLPLSLYVFHRALREEWVSRSALLALVPAALVVHGPVLVGLLALLATRLA